MALFIKDSAPTFMPIFVARGRGEVDGRVKDVEDAFSQAKSRGEATVAFGPLSIVSDVMARLEALRAQFVTTVGETTGTVASSVASTVANATPEPDVTASAAFTGASAGTETDGPITTIRLDATGLAIANYDELSASQVVERLDGLSADELADIRDYELKTRGRRTILGRIDTLTA